MNTLPQRKSLVIDEGTAASWMQDGMTLAIGGFINSSHPDGAGASHY